MGVHAAVTMRVALLIFVASLSCAAAATAVPGGHFLSMLGEYEDSCLTQSPIPEPSPSPLEHRPPVLFVPAMTASKLYARAVKGTKRSHFYCSNSKDWKLMWMKSSNFLPGLDDCWADEMSMVYDAATDIASEAEGIETQTDRTFDSVTTNNTKYPGGVGLYCILFDVMKKMGYQEGMDAFAFPYDWRLAGPQLSIPGGEYENLRNNISSLVQTTGKKLVVIGMSMGGPWFQYFLSSFVDQEWKDQHIDKFISMSGVFGGAAVALQ